MAAKLSITYDEIGDILYLETVKPYPKQETEHLAPDVLGRINPRTGALENIEVLFLTKQRKPLALPLLPNPGRATTRNPKRTRSSTRSKRPRK